MNFSSVPPRLLPIVSVSIELFVVSSFVIVVVVVVLLRLVFRPSVVLDENDWSIILRLFLSLFVVSEVLALAFFCCGCRCCLVIIAFSSIFLVKPTISTRRGSALTRACVADAETDTDRDSTPLVTLVRPLRLRLLVEFRQVRGGYLNPPSFPIEKSPSVNVPDPVLFCAVRRTRRRRQLKEREREREERRRRQRRTMSVERERKKNAPTIWYSPESSFGTDNERFF